jgi:ABC-type nitrate/sulfonate/bicarbonate transport system substrate-binding protein
MDRSGKKLFIAALILGLQLSMAAAVNTQELKKVRFGYPSLGFRQGHIWVAKDEGFFKKLYGK